MHVCCVAGCTLEPDGDIVFFEFPTSKILRNKWIDAIKLTTKPTATSLVCSRHFKSTDSEFIRGKIRLKRKVVPSVFEEMPNSIEPPLNTPEKPATIEDTETITPIAQSRYEKRTRSTTNPATPQKNYNLKRQYKTKNKRSTPKNIINKVVNNNDNENDAEADGDDSMEDDSNTIVESNTKSTDTAGDVCETVDDDRIDDVIGEQPTVQPQAAVNGDAETVNMHNGNAEGGRIDKSTPPPVQDQYPREDIEDIITNYQIENKKTRSQRDALRDSAQPEPAAEHPRDPVFIELSVGDANSKETNDCLMVLESVQCEVDPSLLLAGREDDAELEAGLLMVSGGLMLSGDLMGPGESAGCEEPTRRGESISLLTSSDESDVILEEPHIDTVVVSDDDEDDVPLVRLLLPDVCAAWCTPRTTPRPATVMQVCEMCGFTTASNTQFIRHKRKHKDEKRHKCYMCDYRAKHSMSLTYHMKSHRKDEALKCYKCGFETGHRRALVSHVKHCSRSKRYPCNSCEYSTNRKYDYNRHHKRLHSNGKHDALQ